MQHLSLKATTVSTEEELGTFTALVSAWTADREGDTIDRHAFDQSVADWKASGKNLPLLLEHKTTVVGALDPATMRTEERGLVVAGSVDRESDEGQRVWRAIKSNVASFSIGFMATESRPRKGGGRDLLVIDLLEVSVVSTPMHPDTRALSWKTADELGINDSEYEPMIARNRKHDAEFRERWRRRLRDQEFEEVIAKAEKEEAKAARAARPIQIKTFEIK